MSQVNKQLLFRMKLKSSRQFKILKRRQLSDLERAACKFQKGCAGCPSSVQIAIHTIQELINQVKRAQTVKNWGK